MKRSNKKSVAVFFGAVLLFPLSALADLNAGLIAHWSFDDCTAKDVSSNGNNGIIKGSPQCVTSPINKGFKFNGINSSISLQGVNQYFSTNDFSISYYFNNGDTLRMESTIGKRGICNAGEFIDIRNRNVDIGYELYGGIGNYLHFNVKKKIGIIFVTITRKGKDFFVYYDGKLVSQNTTNVVFNISNTAPFGISISPCIGVDGTNIFSGFIDEVRIYNRALSASEVAELYSSGLPTPTLHVTTLSPTIMRLSWNDNASGEKGYRIQRKTGDCASTNAWANLLDVPANGSAVWDIPVTPNTTYSYQIASYYGGQTFSPYSACVSATSPLAGTPMKPNNLIGSENTATSQSNSQVNLRWDDASNNETRFDIYRKVNSGNWTLLKSVAANTQYYADTTAAGNMDTTSYSYDVAACNAVGCSSLFQNPMVVPFSPSNLVATVGTAVQLTWKDNSNNEKAFQLQRKNGDCASTNFWSYRATISANKQAFNDTSLVSGEIYSYKIRNFTKTAAQPYGFGYSGFSNCVTATAP